VLEADAEVDRRDFTVRAALTVAPGERLALFGPSGAGKTTILEMIAGLVTPRRGTVVLGARMLTSAAAPIVAVPPWQRRVGLLRQDPGLFPHLSVKANLLYGRHGGDAGLSAELAEMVAVLGIDGLLGAMPARLSGGQAHRVALGRLLLSRCDALLLDEPYTGLDANLRRTLTDLVISLVAERGVPSILVAHELAEAQAFADRLAVLDRGEVLQTGTPGDVVRSPATRRVAELVGYTSFVQLPAPGPVPVPVPMPGGPGWTGADATVAAIHPDRVVAGDHPGRGLVLAGLVISCRPAGALWEVTIAVGEAQVTGRLPEPAPAGEQFVLTAIDPPIFGSGGGPAPASGGQAPADGARQAVAENGVPGSGGTEVSG